MGGGLAVTALGLAGGADPSAQAAPAPAPSNHWCPGQQWDPAWGTDRNVGAPYGFRGTGGGGGASQTNAQPPPWPSQPKNR